MKLKILNAIETLRNNFWFMPVLLVIVALIASQVTLMMDDHFFESADVNIPYWLFQGGTESARAVVTVVATSVGTMLSLAVSITMVVFTLSASQYGPQVLRNFIVDSRSQVILGGFIGFFVYSLMVLRTISSVGNVEYVPQISVTLVLAIGVIAMFLLVYFVNHIAQGMRVETLLESIGRELHGTIDLLYPPLKAQERHNEDNDSPRHEEVLRPTELDVMDEEMTSLEQALDESQHTIDLPHSGYRHSNN